MGLQQLNLINKENALTECKTRLDPFKQRFKQKNFYPKIQFKFKRPV
jgi:hypothetical protein